MLYAAGDHVQFGELHFKKGVGLLEKALRRSMRTTRGLENRRKVESIASF